MNKYLISIIYETIERAEYLKTKIEFPLVYPELTGLANRCVKILDDQIRIFSKILEAQDKFSERSVWRNMRDGIRIIEMIEKWGIPALYAQKKDVGMLNKIAFSIHKEINLPLEPPPVSTLSTDYYYTAPVVDVIFVPLAESGFLLHLPDLYHEIGHYVSNYKSEKKLEKISQVYLEAYEEIYEIFEKTIIKRSRERGPEQTVLELKNFLINWENWLEEFFCDLFALYLLGPAYAWSHLHLVTKKNLNIYHLDLLSEQTHPADEARIQIMLDGLKLIGFDSISTEIENKWREVMKPWGDPSVEYFNAYPRDLLTKIAKLILEGMKETGFSIVAPKILTNGDSNSIRVILNDAWKRFWALKPQEFREWEIKELKELETRFFGKG